MQKVLFSILARFFSYLGIDKEKTWISFLGKWFLLSLFIHFVFAVFSTGFHHYDEHFQILEFLNTKLGGTPAHELPWEFHHKMRSWTQPGLYFLIAKFWSVFGVEDPFFLAFCFRLFTSLTGWLSLCTLCFALFFLFKEDVKRKWGVIFLTLTWYIPYLQNPSFFRGIGSKYFYFGSLFDDLGIDETEESRKISFISGTFKWNFIWTWLYLSFSIGISHYVLLVLGSVYRKNPF